MYKKTKVYAYFKYAILGFIRSVGFLGTTNSMADKLSRPIKYGHGFQIYTHKRN